MVPENDSRKQKTVCLVHLSFTRARRRKGAECRGSGSQLLKTGLSKTSRPQNIMATFCDQEGAPGRDAVLTISKLYERDQLSSKPMQSMQLAVVMMIEMPLVIAMIQMKPLRTSAFAPSSAFTKSETRPLIQISATRASQMLCRSVSIQLCRSSSV